MEVLQKSNSKKDKRFLWELPQITILRTNSKIVGTHTFRKVFLKPNSR
ncbi:hypothetical protein LIL_11102 [Leptospira interrogans serovar Linhai str. 56609]|nr:hypothetical protein LIL_11102 [Leptospira interrogans serovar Linhai str. 56609]